MLLNQWPTINLAIIRAGRKVLIHAILAIQDILARFIQTNNDHSQRLRFHTRIYSIAPAVFVRRLMSHDELDGHDTRILHEVRPQRIGIKCQ